MRGLYLVTPDWDDTGRLLDVTEQALEAGATAQVAGVVPAMCDGVTQGLPGMELSLFSRDTIALSTAIALTHDVFDALQVCVWCVCACMYVC